MEKPISLSLSPATNHSPLSILVWLKKASTANEADARDTVTGMLRSACGPYGSSAVVGGDRRLAWGILIPDYFTPLTCWSIYEDPNALCIFAGDLYDNPPVGQGVGDDGPKLAKWIAGRLHTSPGHRIGDLHGVYSCIYARKNCSAMAFADPSGTFPVYWASDDEHCIFSNNLWAFGGCSRLQKRWDRMALLEMLVIGFPLDGRTWINGVRQLQPGFEVLATGNAQAELIKLDRLVDRQSWSLEKSVATLRESLDQTVSSICRRALNPVGLALSGGLDSRILLASLHTQRIPHLNFTFHERRSEGDLLIARKSAKVLNEAHESVALDGVLARNIRLDMRAINEGDSPAFGFMQMGCAVKSFSASLMIGYPGDVYAGVSPGPFRTLRLKDSDTLAKKVLALYMDGFKPEEANALLSPDYRSDWQDVLDEWYNSFRRIEQQSIMDVYMDHVTANRLQRRTRVRLDQTRWYSVPLYPYMDERLRRVYRSLPLSHLESERAHLELLRDYRTGLERLPSAAWSFLNTPITLEYNLRHAIHLGRRIHQQVLNPLSQYVAQARGRLGIGQSILGSLQGACLDALESSPIFDSSYLGRLLADAKRGIFTSRTALERPLNVLVIQDLLFTDPNKSTLSYQLISRSRNCSIRFLSN
jgi:hypothetical protein